MIDLSMRQALVLWSELAAARFGENDYGGDTAEIYAYTLLSAADGIRSGAAGPDKAREDKAGRTASRRLFDMLKLFEEMHGVDIRVEVGQHHDGYPYEWLLDNPIDHRTHVRVRQR